MTTSYRSRWLCSGLLLACTLGCGSELPAPSGPPPVPSGPGQRNVTAPVSSAGTTGAAGQIAGSPSPSMVMTAAAVGGGDPQGLDAGVSPIDAGAVSSTTHSAAGAGGGGGGQGGMSGAAAGASGRAGGGGGGQGGMSGAAGSDDQTCRDVFCFTPIECLFLAIPCGFTECNNFTCR